MRLAGTKLAANHQYRGFGDQLYDLSGQRPSLDLNFANTKSLVDATTGQNLVTFTRASSGTYVDSQGVIRTATTNLLLRSEEFDNASWSKINSSITANTVVALDGTLTGDALVENTSNSSHELRQDVAVVANTQHTASFYFKAFTTGSQRFARVQVSNTGVTSGIRALFDLLAGTVSVAAANFGTGTGASATITSVGDGWYRCTLSGIIDSSSTTARVVIFMQSVGDSYSAVYTGDGTSGIYLWGAQLEQSSTVGEYIPTTSTINSAPRFDHNPTTGESLGLLVEEQRTNLLLRSEEFDNASWNKLAATVSANVEPSPFGLSTADKLTEDATTATHVVQQAPTVISGATYTFSCYLKAAERTFALMARDSAIALGVNLITGQIVGTTGSPIQATSQSVGNGWWRVVLTFTTSSTTHNMNIYTSQDGVFANRSYAGTLGSGIYLWGAQLEAGSFPTSYIPTTTAAVTRSADVASITGSNFSSWYRQDEGTVFVDAASIQNSGRYFMFDDGSTNERWEARYSSWMAQLTSWKAGVADVTVNTNVVPSSPALNVKIAAANKSNDAAIASNGVGNLVGTDSSSSMPSAQSRFWIGSFTGITTYTNGTIKRLTYFPARLANETLQRITQ